MGWKADMESSFIGPSSNGTRGLANLEQHNAWAHLRTAGTVIDASLANSGYVNVCW